MEIKSKHLRLSELRTLEERAVEKGYHWDKGWDHYGYSWRGDYSEQSQSVANWSDGLKLVPSTGRFEVSSLVYHDVTEDSVFDKSDESEVHLDKDYI